MTNPSFLFSNLTDSVFRVTILNMNLNTKSVTYSIFWVLNENKLLLQSLEMKNNAILHCIFTLILPQ